MELHSHRLSPEILGRLARGSGGAQAIAELSAAQYSRHLSLILGVLDVSARRHHPRAKDVTRAYDLLTDLSRQAPEAVNQLIRYPAVGAWAKHTLRALLDDQATALAPAHLGSIAVAAAIRARIPCDIRVPVRQGGITLPSIGRIDLESGEERMVDLQVTGADAVTVDGVRGPLTPLRHLTSADGALDLVLDDLDPHRWDLTRVIDGRLPADEAASWQTCLDEAWRLLSDPHRTIGGELRSLVSALTPIKAPARGSSSASARDRFGAVALSTPPDGRWLAATFAHELQHTKLNAVLDVVDLLRPDQRLFYAPWRDDPRPLAGLLQGAYAFTGVAGFWRRQRQIDDDLRPHLEFARWRAAARDVTGTLLGSDILTEAGERFVTTMRGTLSAWMDEPVPQAALDGAADAAAAHRAAWLARNS
ncbi:HEXXH motif domain-containing protein [Acrocarpospora sp. B8E8]|uniref:HEXXH motif domain-containing protein n=1 Tax=Acrocarpospora sp. B8E8 TaxID=3153572 RepID=UPI00325CBB7D